MKRIESELGKGKGKEEEPVTFFNRSVPPFPPVPPQFPLLVLVSVLLPPQSESLEQANVTFAFGLGINTCKAKFAQCMNSVLL